MTANGSNGAARPGRSVSGWRLAGSLAMKTSPGSAFARRNAAACSSRTRERSHWAKRVAELRTDRAIAPARAGHRDEPMRPRAAQERPPPAGGGAGRTDRRRRDAVGPRQPGRRGVVEGALRCVEREEQAHRHEHDDEVDEERRELHAPTEHPQSGDEEDEEDAAQQQAGPPDQLAPAVELRADDVHPAPVEVRGQADLVPDRELLVVLA